MDLDLFLWNKTKVDILKYLFFKEDKISARELENKLDQSFPAIKKQIDNLEKAWIVNKNKTWNRWQLEVCPNIRPLIKKIFVYYLKSFIDDIQKQNESFIKWVFFVDFFHNRKDLWVDLVFVYSEVDELFLNDFKKQVSTFLDSYFLDLKIVFMLNTDYEKRLRFADKFVIKLNNYKTFIF